MLRYPETHSIRSPLDPIHDMLVLVEYLTTKDYVISTLVSRHSITKKDAAKRAELIVPHVQTATAFIEQSLQTQPELSFLPAYYGILNLMKVYILIGPHYQELSAQRLHGATYPVDEKDSRNLLTEHVVLKGKGAIPLLYKTVTGKALPAAKITMGNIYPYVSGITAEYSLASGQQSRIASFQIEMKPNKNRGEQILTLKFLRQRGDTRQYSLRDFKGLRLFKQDQRTKDIFVGQTFTGPVPYGDARLREHFCPFLIYGLRNDAVETPCCSKRLLLPEELPITLLFFHMSNVVRYKPGMLYKIRSSRFWPMLAAARQHTLLRILVLTWSFVHQKNLELSHKF